MQEVCHEENEVKTGKPYVARVNKKLVAVRIDSTHTDGGWNATNMRTGKRIRIKSARRLQGPAKAEASEATKATAAHDGKPKTAKPAATNRAKSKRCGPKGKTKRLSALDAAAQVLKEAGTPMRAQELIAAMAERGLWKSPAGKTPHATLYAAMMREARDRGKASRFHRVDRGRFAFNEQAE